MFLSSLLFLYILCYILVTSQLKFKLPTFSFVYVAASWLYLRLFAFSAGDRFEERRLDEGVVLALLPLLAHQAGSLFAKYSADSDDSLSLSLAELNIGSRFLEELLALTGGVSGIVDTSPELDRGLLAGLKSTLG